MILPTKHISVEQSLYGIGAELLELHKSPMTVSALWNAIRDCRNNDNSKAQIDYKWFVLALDFLFVIGLVENKRGLIVRRVSND